MNVFDEYECKEMEQKEKEQKEKKRKEKKRRIIKINYYNLKRR